MMMMDDSRDRGSSSSSATWRALLPMNELSTPTPTPAPTPHSLPPTPYPTATPTRRALLSMNELSIGNNMASTSLSRIAGEW